MQLVWQKAEHCVCNQLVCQRLYMESNWQVEYCVCSQLCRILDTVYAVSLAEGWILCMESARQRVDTVYGVSLAEG